MTEPSLADGTGAVRLPPEARHWPRAVLTGAARDDLELLVHGAYPSGPRYLGAAERGVVTDRGTLLDGSPWELPLALELAPGASAAEGDTLVLTDAEGVPMALLRVEEVTPGDDGAVLLAGPLTPVGPDRHGLAGAGLPVAPSDADPVIAVLTDRPLHRHDVRAARSLADRQGARLLMLALTGAGRPYPRQGLVRALEAVLPELDAELRVVPLPLHDGLDPVGRARLAAGVAQRFGAGTVLLPTGAVPGDRADEVRRGLPVEVHHGPPGPLDDAELDHLLATGQALPPGFTDPGVESELRRAAPPADRRGLVVFFTGLSGSGKSTLASAVADALQGPGGRTVTLLDGDVVRTMLSSELSFSREHRELNVRRIGYVAAEVARHGGTAVCAPIAPFAASRADVRRMVEQHGRFLLVHVSTPLEVCEARDTKGLYARARSGLIPAFTGVSDPYETPDDADLVLDTSTASLAECTDRVLAAVAGRG